MIDPYNVLTIHLENHVLPYEAPITVSVIVEMVASDGSFIVFNDGGNWFESGGSQMVDQAGHDLIFGVTQWGANFVFTYLLGRRFLQSKDLSYNVLKS